MFMIDIKKPTERQTIRHVWLGKGNRKKRKNYFTMRNVAEQNPNIEFLIIRSIQAEITIFIFFEL